VTSGADREPTDVRLRRLEDIEAIKQLKHEYVVLLDELIADPSAAEAFVDLFVADLEVEYDAYGSFDSKERLMTFLRSVICPAFSWGFHAVQNPRISVIGDSATAKWYLAAHALPHGGAVVVPFFGTYDDHYVRTARGWKIKKSVLVFKPPPIAA
jgi:hypothetical protein